ncbi:transposase [Streptomyces tuirus]|uniref:Transposase n=1 Tax=Streptomyces tuirus TaxID=68278 RepID=A0A941FM88_9ACTN|nr:transposase [Streptomyces tuirus]
MMPSREPGRPQVRTRRRPMDGIRWRTRRAVPWRDVPERYGPRDRGDDLFRRWQRDGICSRILSRLQAEARAPPAVESYVRPALHTDRMASSGG